MEFFVFINHWIQITFVYLSLFMKLIWNIENIRVEMQHTQQGLSFPRNIFGKTVAERLSLAALSHSVLYALQICIY